MPNIQILGGCQEKGRSCYLLELDGKKILLDCGVKKTVIKDVIGEAPFLDEISIHEIDMVLLSHAHEDHCVYLPYLYRNGYRGKIYCTKPTKDLVPQYIDTWFKVVEKNEGQYPYEKEFVEKLEFEILKYNEILDYEGLKISLLPAGHMLGASMISIQGSRKVIFTGDFSFDNRVLLDPSTKIEANLLICDGNHGMDNIDKIEEEKVLIDFIEKISSKGNILIPIAPFGRLQEILIFLKEKNFRKPIILDKTLKDAYKKYDEYSSWLSTNWISWTELRKILDIREYNDPEEALMVLSSNKENGLILASNAMLTGGLSREYLKYLGHDKNNGIILNGHQDKSSLGYKILCGEEDIPIQKIFLNLKVHPDGQDIHNMLKDLNPKCKIIVVHSSLQKAQEIKEKYSYKDILIPKVLEKIEF